MDAINPDFVSLLRLGGAAGGLEGTGSFVEGLFSASRTNRLASF